MPLGGQDADTSDQYDYIFNTSIIFTALDTHLQSIRLMSAVSYRKYWKYITAQNLSTLHTYWLHFFPPPPPPTDFSHSVSVYPLREIKSGCVSLFSVAPSYIASALNHPHSHELSVWSRLGIVLINSAETTVYKDITSIMYVVQSQGQVAQHMHLFRWFWLSSCKHELADWVSKLNALRDHKWNN